MKRPVALLLILLTLALFYNNAVNWHYHQLPNGVIVEHAHPYEKASPSSGYPYQNHQHSDLEYLILDLVYNSGLIIILTILLILVFGRSQPRQRLLMPATVIDSKYSRLPLLRAPPVS